MLDITDFQYWVDHPITKKIFEKFREEKEIFERSILNGDYFGDEAFHKVLYYKGCITIYNEFLSLTFNDIKLLIKEVNNE